MRKHIRLVVGAALLVAGATLGAPASATPTYPPVTPSPSVSSVPPSVLDVSASRGVSTALPRTDELPLTGGEIALWGGAGALLVTAGAAVTVASRRRPSRSH